MYYFNALNHFEFEELCCDVATKILGIPVRMFAQGRDNGVDIKDSSSNKKIIIQVKHYSNSASLYRALVSELEKVLKLKPKSYYIMTGIQLSSTMRTKIYELFKCFMGSEENIIDGIDINGILKDDPDIVKKNFKLWLHSENILEIIQNKNIYIDSHQLRNELNKLAKLYVKTKHYDIGMRKLKDTHILVITGGPASGKTILSKMLLLDFVKEGFKIRYSSSNNIDDIKKSLSTDPENKEIILLDDVLGQTALDISSNNLSNLMDFINLISSSTNKFLILNSRITIFNQLKHENQKFTLLTENHSISINFIEIQNYSNIEKAKILFNHLMVNLVPNDYITELMKNKRYHSIIKHGNYNPRIIELMTTQNKVSQIPMSKYYSKLIDSLDNDDMIWTDEYIKFSEQDKIYVLAMYSESVVNGNRLVDKSRLLDIFHLFLKLSKTVHFDNEFNKSTEKLNKSIIRIISNNGNIQFAFANPSFVDYFKRKVNINNNYESLLLNNISKISGLTYISKNKSNSDFLVERIINRKLKSLFKSEPYEEHVLLLTVVIKMSLFDLRVSELFKEAIVKYLKEPVIDKIYGIDSKGVDLHQIYNSEVIEYYRLDEIDYTSELFEKLLLRIDSKYMPVVSNNLLTIASIKSKHPEEKDELIDIMMRFINKAIDEYLYSELKSICSDVVKTAYDPEEIEEQIKTELEDIFTSYCDKFDLVLKEKIEFIPNYDIFEMIDDEERYQEAMADQYDYEAEEDRFHENKEKEYIDNIFTIVEKD